MKPVAVRLIAAARKLLSEDLTLWETEPPVEPVTAKKRTPKKPCPSCGKRVPFHQVPPFEGHRPGCATVIHWNRSPRKGQSSKVEVALLTRDQLIREGEKAEQEMMDFVVDALGSWSDEEIDRHLQDLKARVKDRLHPKNSTSVATEDFDVETELQCWSKALAEFGDYLKSAAAPEVKLYTKHGGRWALALVYPRDDQQFGLDKKNAQEVAEWVADLRGPGYKVVVDGETFVTGADGGIVP